MDQEASTIWSGLQTRGLQVGQRWRHHGGGVYRIAALAIATSTMRPIVVYGLGDPARTWAQPLDEFLGSVDGTPRFVHAGETAGDHGASHADLAKLETQRVNLRRRLDVLRERLLGSTSGVILSNEESPSPNNEGLQLITTVIR
jgi:hypothetical protein